MPTLELWHAPLIAAIGWLFKWLIDKRLRSGRIDTTDAEQLWEEQRKFREQMRRELERRVKECKLEVRSIQLQNLELRIENHELRADNMRLQFLTHPEIPQDVKDEFIEHQRQHVERLRAALKEAADSRKD
jgi:hypothetical protein